MKIPYINKVLKGERRKQGITQVEFANLIYKSLPTIKRYDTGGIIPESVLRQMCNVLEIDFIDLLRKQFRENNDKETCDYDDIIHKYYVAPLADKAKKVIESQEKDDAKFYKTKFFKEDLKRYLMYIDYTLEIETTKEEKEIKAEKILSFIEFLYFQNMIKK